MGIRVTKGTLKKQIEITGQLDFLKLPYYQAILNAQIPLSIGGGIGQSRLCMFFLRTAHIGEVSCGIWPEEMQAACARANITLL